MKKGRHEFKYVRQFYVRVAYGCVELEICPARKNKIIDASKKTAMKEGAIIAAQYILSTYQLPENVEIIIHNIIDMPADTKPLHICAATIIGIFDICESPLSKEEMQRLDRFVLLNDQKGGTDFSSLELSKDKIEV